MMQDSTGQIVWALEATLEEHPAIDVALMAWTTRERMVWGY
jgi:hypothetical protein